MRTNYVLIDFENVQPKSLDDLAHDHFKIVVFVGAKQTNVPVEMVTALHLRNRIDFIRIAANGSNALDFHIAYYIGRFAAEDPSAYFHIVSKDTGFDPLIDHLRTNKIFAGRVKAISDIPIVRVSNCSSLAERLDAVVGRLRQFKSAKPKTVKTLSSTIATLFQKKLSEKEVSALVNTLVNKGYVTISSSKITYGLPSDC